MNQDPMNAAWARACCCALAIGSFALSVAGCASSTRTVSSTTSAAAEAIEHGPQQRQPKPDVPLGHPLTENVLCHELRVNGVVVPSRNSIQVVNGGVSWEGSCVEVTAEGRVRTVPGQCMWLRSASGPCGEAE